MSELQLVARPERQPVAAASGILVQPLVADWLLELRVMGRSQPAIERYRQKMAWYLEHECGPETQDRLTACAGPTDL